MRTIIEFFKGRKKTKSEELAVSDVLKLLEGQDIHGRCIQFGRPGLGLLQRTINQSNVNADGLCQFVKVYIPDYSCAFHEEYSGFKGSMHYIDLAVPIGGPKFKDGKWAFGIDYYEPTGKIKYFKPRSE